VSDRKQRQQGGGHHASDKREALSQPESERLFASTFQHAAIGLAHVSPDGHWLRVNRQLCDMLGYSEAEMLSLRFQDLTHPDDVSEDVDSLRPMHSGDMQHYIREKRYLRKDGKVVWVSLNVAVERKPDGSPDFFITAVRDISEQKRREAFLLGQQQVLEAIARSEQSLEELLLALVELVESQLPDARASLLMLDGERLRHVAAPSLPPEYCAAVDGMKVGPSAGACGTAAFQKQRVIVADIATDPRWADFAELANRFDLHSCWSQPVLSARGEMLATFAIYHPKVSSPDAADIQLLESIASLAAIVIEHKRTEHDLQENEAFYRQLFDTNQAVKLLIDAESGAIADANAAAVQFYGHPRETLCKMNIADINILSRDEVTAEMARANAEERLYFMFKHRLADGSIRDVEVYSGPVNFGGRQYLYSIIHDITPRVEAQRGLVRRDLQLAELAIVGREINRSRKVHTVMRKLVRSAMRMVGAKSGVAGLVVGGEMVFDEYQSGDKVIGCDFHFPPGKGVPGWILQGKQPYVTEDAGSDNRVLPEVRDSIGFRQMANVPIIGPDSDVLGCFQVHDKLSGERFSEQDIEMLGGLADTAAIALSNLRAGEQLRKSEERYRGLVDSLKEVVFQTDATGLWTFLNPAWAEVTGFRVDDSLGNHFRDYIYPDDRERSEMLFASLLDRSSDSSHHEIRYRFADGGFRWVEVFARLLVDDEGEVIGTAGTLTDVTERRQREEQLRKLIRAIEYAGESIIITDAEGRIEYVNPAFTRIAGYEPAEVLGLKPSILKSGKQDEQFYAELWQTLSSGQQWSGTLIVRRKSGEFYPASMTASPIFGENGEITNYVGIQQDISEQQMLETQLRQAQKMESLGTLVGGIAHDFNNILAGMTGNLYLLRKALADMPDVTRRISAIEKLGYRAAEMISQMLTFARKDSIEMHDFSLTSFIKEAFKLARVTIPETVTIETSFDTEEMMIQGNTTQLQQVLFNLLGNARDAVEECPEPRISLFLERLGEAPEDLAQRFPRIEGKPLAHFCIADNGVGIDREDVERIFEPFFTTKGVGKGTGLGLAMVYGSIRRHNGVVEVQSEKGEGTEVHIYLPLVVGISGSDSETTPGGMEIPDSAGTTVLLADDDNDVRETVAEVLRSLDYTVLTVENGEAACRRFEGMPGEVDLVILDLVMPVMGGSEAAERIRQLRPDVPIVFATGYDKSKAIDAGRLPRRSAVLSKPFQVSELAHVIDRLLRENKLPDPG